MSRTPRVSVGLPVYNGARFLRQTLDDWRRQSFEDYELVVCDNASTDATPEILAEYAAQDDRLRIVRNAQNLGAQPNLNLAFTRSTAPLYVLSAHDDRHAPDFLSRLVDALDRRPDAGLAYGDGTLVGEDGRPFRYSPEHEAFADAGGTRYDYDVALHRPLPADPVARYRAALHATNTNAPIYGLFRRAVLARTGPFQIHGADRLIVAHAALLTPWSYVDAPLFAFRIHGASTYYLTREEWRAREVGRAGTGSPLDGVRTLRRYLAATQNADLSVADQVRAAWATLGSAVRPDVLRRAVLPGRDSYWGWTHWPGQEAPPSPPPLPPAAAGPPEPRWAWLVDSEEHGSLEPGGALQQWSGECAD